MNGAEKSEELIEPGSTVFSRMAAPFSRLRKWVEGGALAFEPQGLDERTRARIRAAQLAAIIRNTPLMLMVATINIVTFLFVMWDWSPAYLVWTWALSLWGVNVYMYLRRARDRRAPPREASARGIKLAVIYASLHGLLWGVLPALFFKGSTPQEQLVVIGLTIGMLCGGAFALSPIPTATVAYLAPIVVGATYAFLADGDHIYNILVLLVIAYMIVMVRAANVRQAAIARRVVAEVETEDGASNDALTGLVNRRSFVEKLQHAFARHARFDERFAVMYFDLDGFKIVNDTLGHAAGDEVLIEAARRLRSVTRAVDWLARIGGDEFALIAADVDAIEQAEAIAERINAQFRRPFEANGHSWKITISIGIAFAPQDGADVDAVLRNAEAALCATKQAGRGGYSTFSGRLTFVAEGQTLESELRRAIRNNELFLVFQPFVSIATGETTGFEALLRWRHPALGVLSANEFIPLAERGGHIDEVGAWLIREGVRIAASWPAHLRIALNVSPLQLRRPALENAVREALVAERFDPRRLELEITESAIIADTQRAVATLKSLRRLGIKTALDDFGTGYSSLSNLVELPLDRLKIDRSFVSDLLTKPMCASVVRISLELARAMQLEVTAEGLETDEHFEFLRAHGCDEGQGYLFSEPRPASELAPLFGTCPRREFVDHSSAAQ